jgi:hypothetical protein
MDEQYPITFRVAEANGSPVKGAKITVTTYGCPAPVTLVTGPDGRVAHTWTSSFLGWVRTAVTAPGFLAYPSTLQDTAGLGWGGGAVHDLDLEITRDPKFFASWVQIIDKDTQQAITGAKVYINDVATDHDTDGTGKVWIAGKCGSVTIKIVKTPDYNASWMFTLAEGQAPPSPMAFRKVPPTPRLLAFHTQPDGVVITLYGPSDTAHVQAIEPVLCDMQGVGTTSKTYIDGTMFLAVARKTGYTDKETFVTVKAGQDAYPVDGPQKIDNGSTEGTTKADPNGTDGKPQTALVPVATAPASAYDYEWLFPNGEEGKYFTTTQARMYIGNLFIDELNTVQFAYQGNRVPIYGYCSEDMDAVGSGRRLVQGQILINFLSEGYLYTVLNEYQRMMAVQKDPTDSRKADAEYLASLTQRLEDRGAGAADENEISMIQDEMTRLSSNPQTVDDAHIILVNKTTLKTTRNAIALKIPFTIVMELTGGGRTVTRTLEDCVLTSNEQIYDQSGQTLLDAYGFIARRLI